MVTIDLHYVDTRLVSLYDHDNPRGIDTDFYRQLADELDARRIIDLGCGTGLLTRELATVDRDVWGIDPASAMLAYARSQPGADRVHWQVGTADDLGTADADLVLMTGNVTQVFLDDAVWHKTLSQIHDALRVGGTVAFEARNPTVKAWESWQPALTFEQTETPYGLLECWLDVKSVQDGIVHMEGHNIFKETGERLIIDSRLRFRHAEEIVAGLEAAGFAVTNLYGGWRHEPFTDSSRLMVFIAQRNK